VDHLGPAERSENMRRVKGKDTGPEHLVRRTLHAFGLRFRLHKRDLPGKPDIVLAKHKTAIFVHGCFWHRHEGCSRTSMPSTRPDFWNAKFRRTVERDAEQIAALTGMGWRPIVIWECEARRADTLKARIEALFPMLK
jgi:DNA mismatch endonuclease (patch repair protein)